MYILMLWIYFVILDSVFIYDRLLDVQLKKEDLLTGHTYNFLGLGAYDKATDLHAAFQLFNVPRYYSINES